LITQNSQNPLQGRLKAISLVGMMFLSAGMSARADQFTFNFNSLASGAPASGGVGINASIQNYMNNILGGNYVNVIGAVADKTYNGEGFVVGPGNGSKSLTLGTSDLAGNDAAAVNTDINGNVVYDTFIATTNDSSSKISNEMTMKFINGFVVNGNVSFDFEIFPDGTSTTNPLNPPDFTFVGGATTWTVNGVTPGTTNGGSTHSPKSGSTNNEPNLQYIGHWSGNVTNATELDFIDWPPTIAIDNLVISRVPEPGAIVLLGTGLAALLFLKRKRNTSSI
jgi:hypothetical protein